MWIRNSRITIELLGVCVCFAVLSLVVWRVGAADPVGVDGSLVLTYKGDRLSVRRVASVPYSDLSTMLAAIRSESLTDRYAILQFRESPQSLIGYVLVVDREGTLSVGKQIHEWDLSDRRYRFLKGDLYRSYQPLEGNSPWTWLVEIPVNRENWVSLKIRAEEGQWPLKSVAISIVTDSGN